MEVNSQ